MRYGDWEARLGRLIASCQGAAFSWGQRDCFTLVRDAVFAQSPTLIWGEIQYASALQAGARLREHGFAELGDALALALPEIGPSFAGRGDVGVVLAGGREAGVVVLGAEVAGMAPGRGLTILPRSRLVRAFKVG